MSTTTTFTGLRSLLGPRIAMVLLRVGYQISDTVLMTDTERCCT
ncbi:hypothetical protein HMPREF9057_01762 [Actinomyces sp. oral taxon 171 str. F0337]|nr:hypothetical protein HMPREF9057_01762 [Actinomyces sp. oral taxon 171 str. F0337]